MKRLVPTLAFSVPSARLALFLLLVLMLLPGEGATIVRAALPTVPAGFEIDTFTVVTRPTTMAFAPAGSAFGDDLYVAGYGDLNGDADSVFRVSETGVVTLFTTLVSEADPVDLAFPPPGSPYGDYLYLSAGNRDFGNPNDCGGTIERVDSIGNVIDLTTVVGCAFCGFGETGLGEPNGIAFGSGGGFGNELYVGNSSDVPGDLCRVSTVGAISTFVDDNWCNAGLAPILIAFGPGGAFGNDLYFGDFGTTVGGCSCIRTVDSAGVVSAPWVTLPNPAYGLAFASTPGFGNDLYATAEDTVYRIDAAGNAAPFAWNFGDALFLNIEFSRDGEDLYVLNFDTGVIYRIRASVEVDVPLADRGSSIRLLPSTPNPFTHATTLRFELGAGAATSAGTTGNAGAANAPATVCVYSASGRLVRDLDSHETAFATPRSVLWDGRDARGKRLPAGVYFYRVESGGRGATGKVTLVR